MEWRPRRILEDFGWKVVDWIIALQTRVLRRMNEDD